MSKKGISINEFKDQVNPSPELMALRQEMGDLRSKIKGMKIDKGKIDTYYRAVTDHLEPIKPITHNYDPSKSTSVASSMGAVLHLTDWHMGERVFPSEIENFNVFDPNIARDRVFYLAEKLLDWVMLHRSVYKIETLTIICTGDFISGDIHEELVRTSVFPPPIQAVEAGRLLAEMTATFAPHFKNIEVHFVVPDNHSRLSKRVPFKQSGLNSHNFTVGFVAQSWLKDHTNVDFRLLTPISNIVKIQDYRYLCAHGNNIKGWSGFPYYGIDRLVSNEAKIRLRKPDKNKFDKLLIGHFHAPLKSPNWMLGGSLSGTNEFDHAYARESDPIQTAWLMHPKKRRELNYMEFELQDAPRICHEWDEYLEELI